MRTEPCDWPLDYLGGMCDALSNLKEEGEHAKFEDLAVEYLWNWTGRKYGLCEVTVRPCREDCVAGSTFQGDRGAPWTPTLINGKWYNFGCASCVGSRCSCSYVPTLQLPGPVESVIEVQIDGETLSESAYRVDNERFLVRVDGGDWPSCQDLSVDDGEPGSWSVTYKRGIKVPAGGRQAAARLACEFALAAVGDRNCSLPQRVQTITRQGVTVAMLDSFDDIDKGHTGIWVIDSWVASVMRRPRSGIVMSPDYGGARSAPITRRT